MSFNPTDIQKLEKYLQSKLGNNKITLKTRAKADDSVEFLLDGEYMGTVYKDEEDGDISYNLNISVLSIDLDEAA
jgi:Protein of unknown function (DUF3126)